MSRNSLLRRAAEVPGRSRSHRRSRDQEKELATRVGGKCTPGSGSKSVKGDVRVKGVIRIEAKTTKNKSFSVTQDMLDKIEEAALAHGELPIIVVEFNDGNGRKLREVAVVPTYVLSELGL